MNMVEDLAHAIRAAGVTPDTGRAEARDRIGGIETSIASPDGLVRVTISAAGELRGVDIAPGAFRRTGEAALADSVADTIRAACDLVRRAGAAALGRG
ncbi:MAG TPA: YbaB/EbfC family nucleoid-associated protein [Dactylosporangium sp.]|jgi:DNA-binding protein YbaB|nr:YbaB/EbfC family nucleoid-associated protein [Dactylosporangium sp.]